MTRRDDIVAALERATLVLADLGMVLPSDARYAALLRALADSLREGQEAWEAWGGVVVKVEPAHGVERAVWIIPEPKVKP